MKPETLPAEVVPIQQAAAPALARPIAKPHEVIEYHKEVAALIESALTKDTDFGIIPGTDKPTLLKPGAERLCLAFGCVPRFEIVEQEIDHNREIVWTKRKRVFNNKFQGDRSFIWQNEQGTSLGIYRYVLRCRLERADGRVLGEGVGSCSSLESKYIDRARDLENTILKMAKKRAQVDAVLTAFALSNRFTQDVEDIKHNESPPPAQSGAAQNQQGDPDEHMLPSDKEKALKERDAIIKAFLETVADFEDKGGHAATTLTRDPAEVIKMPPERVRAATKLLQETLKKAMGGK